MTSVPSREDAADVMAREAGDTEAFEAELGPLLPEAIRLATGLLLDAIEAEDAVQDSCVRAWRSRVNRRAGTPLRPWFLGIVANQCREVRRGHWWQVVRIAAMDVGTPAKRDDLATTIDLRDALARVSYRRRLVLVLRYYLDLSFEDVAASAGCSVDAAKALARRGIADLERALGSEGRS